MGGADGVLAVHWNYLNHFKFMAQVHKCYESCIWKI